MKHVHYIALLVCIGGSFSCGTNNPETEFFGITETFENGQPGANTDRDDWRVQVHSGPSEPWFDIAPCHPNPVSRLSSTSLVFSLQRSAYVQCDIINKDYDRVISILDRSLSPGTHSVAIDLKDDDNNRLAPGLYRLTITAATQDSTNSINARITSYGDIQVDPD